MSINSRHPHIVVGSSDRLLSIQSIALHLRVRNHLDLVSPTGLATILLDSIVEEADLRG
jgi:hypothetical protein